MILSTSEKTEYIKQHSCTTKEGALKMLKKKTEHYMRESENSTQFPQTYYALLIVLLHTFLERIEKAVLFDVLPDEWAYCFDFEYDEFSLNIEHICEIEVDEDGDLKSSLHDAAYKLITISPKAFTVDQYAQFYKVEQGTIRQWIRRGKIRAAYKEGNEWKIPELTPPPSRGYEGAQYKWIRGIDNLPDEYEYLKDYVIATFYQDRSDKSKYHVLLVSKDTFIGNGTSTNKELLLDAKEREKLELFMIGHPQIKYCGWMI